MPVTPSPQKTSITLPLPLNTKTKKYTKPEAVELLFFTQMNSRAHGDMMAQIIELGYTPTSKSTLWHLMQKRDAGKEVADSPWAVTHQNKAKPKGNGDCDGIQSQVLDQQGKDNIGYCYSSGFYINGSSQHWYDRGCTRRKDVDTKGRCTCCCSAYRNMNKNRHPSFFE